MARGALNPLSFICFLELPGGWDNLCAWGLNYFPNNFSRMCNTYNYYNYFNIVYWHYSVFYGTYCYMLWGSLRILFLRSKLIADVILPLLSVLMQGCNSLQFVQLWLKHWPREPRFADSDCCVADALPVSAARGGILIHSPKSTIAFSWRHQRGSSLQVAWRREEWRTEFRWLCLPRFFVHNEIDLVLCLLSFVSLTVVTASGHHSAWGSLFPILGTDQLPRVWLQSGQKAEKHNHRRMSTYGRENWKEVR